MSREGNSQTSGLYYSMDERAREGRKWTDLQAEELCRRVWGTSGFGCETRCGGFPPGASPGGEAEIGSVGGRGRTSRLMAGCPGAAQGRAVSSVADHLHQDHDVVGRLQDLLVVVVEAGAHGTRHPARSAPVVEVQVVRPRAGGEPRGRRRR